MIALLNIVLVSFYLSAQAAPLLPVARDTAEKFVLPSPPAIPPGPTFDPTATRAATGAQIRNAAQPNLCFDVSNFRAGDFRFNLVPIALKPCDATVDGQKFDLITKGQHNDDSDGSKTIIVSSQQFTCVDRRSNINDRTRPGLFACGGRAAGDGTTTADQQYFFNSKASLTAGIGFPLVQDAQNNGAGNGNQCLTLNKDGFLSNTACSPPNFTPEQTWFVEKPGTVAQSPPPAQTSSSASVSTTKTTAKTTAKTTSTSAASASASNGPETFVLPNPPQEPPGPTFDSTATRAATKAQIKNAANPNLCFDVSDFRTGDARFNLVPIALKACDSTIAGQQFDLITKGEHNDDADGSKTIIVSSQQLTCVDRRSNKNDRTRPGLFACGGRAAGDGQTTADQQYFFNSTASLTGGIGFPLVTDAVNKGVGSGNQCLTFDSDGFLINKPCSPPNFAAEQTWFVQEVGGSNAITQAPPPKTTTQASTRPPTTKASSTSVRATTSKTGSSAAASATGPETFVLPNPPQELPGPTFDSTATRAATKAQIKNAANPNLCFDVSDFRTGDARFNLVPIALKACDSTIAGQQFDLITKGEHNDDADGSKTIIVSSQQLTCVDRRSNKNDRTRPGLFACGGRAAGDGQTTADQQYFFNSTASLTGGIGFPLVTDAVNKGVGSGNQCLTFDSDGFLINKPCSPPNFAPEQTWFVQEVGKSNSQAPPPPATTSKAAATTKATTQATTSTTVRVTTTSTTAKAAATSPETFVLPNPPAIAPGPTFDSTATRAATKAHIRNAANPNLCFDVSDFRTGDFRFNLVPIALKPCDASVEGQTFDLITKGQHNDDSDGSKTIIVSSQQLTCVDRRSNINDRTRPGLFACGGRAAGDGGTTADQQYFFNSKASLTGGIGFPLVANAQNNGVGDGNQCLTFDSDGFLINKPCSPPNFAPEQTWIVESL